MTTLTVTDRPPRDPQKLLAEASARIAVRDIRRRHELRDVIRVQWWELLLGMLTFPIALGLLLLLVRLAEFDEGIAETTRMALRAFYGAFGLFVLVLLASYDAMTRKHRAIRYYLDEIAREVDDLRKTMRELEKGSDDPDERRPARG
jgi:hypothetical protein